VYVPVYAPATRRAAEPVAWTQAGRGPWRLIELHPVDLPRRHASSAKQEGQRDRATYLRHLGRSDADVAKAAAGLAEEFIDSWLFDAR